MFRDSFIALQEYAKYRKEMQEAAVAAAAATSDSSDSMDTDNDHVGTDRLGPTESIRPRDFEPIGSILHPFWYSPQHGRGNIRLAKKEIKRWERSIAFLDNEEIPNISESVRSKLFRVFVSVGAPD